MNNKFMKPISAEFFFSIDLAYLTCYWLAKNLMHSNLIFAILVFWPFTDIFKKRFQTSSIVGASRNRTIMSINSL